MVLVVLAFPCVARRVWFIPKIGAFQVLCSCGSMVEFEVGVERRRRRV